MMFKSKLSCFCMALVVLAVASPAFTAATYYGAAPCSICHHKLELLTMVSASWKQAISDSLAAEQQGIYLNMSEENLNFTHITSEWEGQGECLEPLASLSKALWSFTEIGIKKGEDIDLDNLKTLREGVLTQIENLKTHRQGESDKEEWDFFETKINEFADVALEKFESAVAIAVVNILKREDNITAAVEEAVKLMTDNLQTLDCDEMRDVINVAYSHKSKVSEDMTRKLMMFGKGVWPDRSWSFYGKLSRKLTKLLTDAN